MLITKIAETTKIKFSLNCNKIRCAKINKAKNQQLLTTISSTSQTIHGNPAWRMKTTNSIRAMTCKWTLGRIYYRTIKIANASRDNQGVMNKEKMNLGRMPHSLTIQILLKAATLRRHHRLPILGQMASMREAISYSLIKMSLAQLI